MIDDNRLRELASAAQSDHWPPHLLAPFDNKVEVLGQALGQALDTQERTEELQDTNAALQEENDMLTRTIDDLKSRLNRVAELAVIK